MERPLRSFKELRWSHKLQVQATGSSWTSQYQLVLPFISSFLTIFQLYGVRRTWWAIHIFKAASLDPVFCILNLNALYFKFINILGQNSKISHVLLSNIEETVPFTQHLVVNSCNFDGIEYMCAPLMIYELINCD